MPPGKVVMVKQMADMQDQQLNLIFRVSESITERICRTKST